MSDKEKPPSSGFSTGQIIALSCLGIAFIIILVMLVYYWWEVRQERSSQVLATELLDVNPIFAQAIILRQVACKGNIPKWKPPKSSAADPSAGPKGPGLFGALAGGVGGLAASAKGFLASKGGAAAAAPGGPGLTNKAKGFLGKIGTTFGNSISKLKTAAGSAASAAAAKVGEKVKKAGDAIKEKGDKLAEDIKKKGTELTPDKVLKNREKAAAEAKAAANKKKAEQPPAPAPDPQLEMKKKALQQLINESSKAILTPANLNPKEKAAYNQVVAEGGNADRALAASKSLRQMSLDGYKQSLAALK